MICDTCKYLDIPHNKYPCSECLKYRTGSKHESISKAKLKEGEAGMTEHKFIKLTSKKVDGKNNYSIHYFDETDGKIHIGFSSSSLDVISDFLTEFFIKNNEIDRR